MILTKNRNMRFNLNIAVIFIFLLSFMICLSSVCASEDIADFNETSGNLLVFHGSDLAIIRIILFLLTKQVIQVLLIRITPALFAT